MGKVNLFLIYSSDILGPPPFNSNDLLKSKLIRIKLDMTTLAEKFYDQIFNIDVFLKFELETG